MQREDKIPIESLEKIIEAVYQGALTVFEAYSEFEADIREFPTKESLGKLISDKLADATRHKFIYCCLKYSRSKGLVKKRKIDLDPRKCNGATYRYTMEGWGLIQFQLDLTNLENISCRFACNSERRADIWSDVYPELESPSLWDWTVIEKNIRRLIRVLRKHAKT